MITYGKRVIMEVESPTDCFDWTAAADSKVLFEVGDFLDERMPMQGTWGSHWEIILLDIIWINGND